MGVQVPPLAWHNLVPILIKLLFFDMQIFKVDSTAISQIGVDGDQVSVTYTSSEKDYPFQAQDPDTFVADLKTQMDEKQSIGSFIHQCRKQGQLTDVTV